jgi:predicted Zn-dependent peptidase
VEFKEVTLKNGLRIVSEYRPSAVSVAIGFLVKAGARDETPEISGVSHFLEHMLFKGTAKRSALDITYEMGAMGAQANAFTSEESTVYYMAVLPEYFEKAFDLLSDMMRSSIDPEEFVVEKKVILEEIALYQDRPTYMLLESSLGRFFKNHTAGNSVLGSIQSITDLTRDQMYDYFQTRYSPSNIVLSVAGDFDHDRLIELAEKYCGSWEDKKVERVYPPYVSTPESYVMTKQDLQRAHVMLLAPGPSMTHDYRYEADVLTTILGDSNGSKLYWELVHTGLSDGASVESEQMDGVGIMYGYASTTRENLDQVTEIAKKIMSSPLNFTDEDLERAVTKTATRMVLQGESTMKRMMNIGFDWLYNAEYVPLQAELDRLKRVTRSRIETLVTEFNMIPTHEVRLISE